MKKYVFIYSCFLLFLIAVFPFCHKLSKQVVALHRNKTTIVIDVGHGGSDPGKVGIQGIKEKDVNLAIARYLKDYLIAEDYTVYMTRETDQGLYNKSVSNKKKSDLSNRIQFLQKKNASCMISIHQNSYHEESIKGAQVFYYTHSKEGERAATVMQEALKVLDINNKRQAKENSTYYMLKRTEVPTIIVECGFLSNVEEAEKLKNEEYQDKVAEAICAGIIKWLD